LAQHFWEKYVHPLTQINEATLTAAALKADADFLAKERSAGSLFMI
jgi:hypothetical protein